MVSIVYPLHWHAEEDANYLILDIDIISTSAIHQGVPHVDYSLKIDH